MGRRKKEIDPSELARWTILLEEALAIQLLQESKTEADFCSREIWQLLRPNIGLLIRSFCNLEKLLTQPPREFSGLAAILLSSRRLLVRTYLSIHGLDSTIRELAGQDGQEITAGNLTVPEVFGSQLTSYIDQAKRELRKSRGPTEDSLTSGFTFRRELNSQFNYELLLIDFRLTLALERLVGELDEILDDSETSVPDEPNPPSPVRGGPLYDLVRLIQSFYPQRKLPMDVRKDWVVMLRISGGEIGEFDDEQYWAFYDHCRQFQDWARSEMSRFEILRQKAVESIEERLSQSSLESKIVVARKPGPKPIPEDERREDKQLVADWEQASSAHVSKPEFCKDRKIEGKKLDTAQSRVRNWRNRANK